MKMEQSVSKRRHIKFRRRVITQKKAYKLLSACKSFHYFCPVLLETNAPAKFNESSWRLRENPFSLLRLFMCGQTDTHTWRG